VSALRLGAHAGAPLQTVNFSYFYERNLVLGAIQRGVKRPRALCAALDFSRFFLTHFLQFILYRVALKGYFLQPRALACATF
jgi:hypothetical protein